MFVNDIRNVICERKICSVVWHLDGCSVFLFSAPRKSVSNVSTTENMEQQEQKLMQRGGFHDCYSAHISGRHTPCLQISPEKSAE